MTDFAETLAAIRSLGLRSDVLVLTGEAETELHPDRIVLRSPSQPDFWWGNMVMFRSDRVDPEAQQAQFRADFPQARHVTLAWDVPEMAEEPGHARLAEMGYEIEQIDALTLDGPPRAHPHPEGIEIRPIDTETEWEQVVALQTAIGVEEGHVLEGYEPYLLDRFRVRRKQIAKGWGQWIGAFDGDLLVGDLGVFVASGVARYQSVETRASHRRRGICAAMVLAGVDWVRSIDPEAVPVIIALSDGPAGRVYRSCGFTRSETQVVATLPPEGAKRPT
ncbi:hypothetical protein R3X27_00820 [Tropicimonas sp. TH_r6]|uniref:GNAT family N-acetyltransferase n=1 Tax=Tropicimonas sp. TH_r6 TaxID=3082085 RepID=UPI00295322E4|nr:hypothetical protein [Tropicimonas sp. TH_r6]MDV7141214.1 hypothetical protein [Tropicimonas sp. TH_r6]